MFFTSGGSEAVESAWKLVRSHFVLKGEPERHRVIARHTAYHGTTLGALSITGVDAIRDPFLPLLNGAVSHVTNTKDCWRGVDLACADEIEQAILARRSRDRGRGVPRAGAERRRVPAPPPGYFQRVREICDRHGVLLVSDEVICGFGRLASGSAPSASATGPTCSRSPRASPPGTRPLGGVLVGDTWLEPFREGPASFAHGITFGGHPVSCAVALANLDVMEREDLSPGPPATRPASAPRSSRWRTWPWCTRPRHGRLLRGGAAPRGRPLSPDRCAGGDLVPAQPHPELGVYCRVDDRGDPAIMIAPPLIVGPEEPSSSAPPSDRPSRTPGRTCHSPTAMCVTADRLYALGMPADQLLRSDTDIGRLLRTGREEAGLTQAALAARLRTTQSVVSRWERGGDEPRLSTLVRVLRACGQSLTLSIRPEDDGIDRAQIRQQLAMTPAERLASVTNVSRTLANARRVG